MTQGQLLKSAWYARYQYDNPEKFNEDFIYSKASSENMKEIIEFVSRSIEDTGFSHIKFMGCEIEEDESKFQELHTIEESRLIQATIKFKLFCKDDPEGDTERDVSIRLLLPKLIDNFFYQLNGCRYFAIYQMIDRGTYSVGDSIGLKTMLMPFTIRPKNVEIVDAFEQKYTGRLMELSVFTKNVNILLYYFSEGGVQETFDFFGVSDKISVSEFKEDMEAEEGKVYFICKDILLTVDEEYMRQDKWLLFTLISILNDSKATFEKISQHDFWNLQLGKIYTSNKDQAIKKAKFIHLSIRRILDGNTKKNMVHVIERDKKTIYNLFRWILFFYDDLLHEDNMDLKNKRLRLNEYILYPFINKMSDETYRCFNTKKLTMKLLASMFSNIKPNLCTKQLVTNELLRFVNTVNGVDLFSAALKITQAGPQGLNDTDNIPIRYRGIHSSYIGKIGLTAASAGEPGITATMTPFVKLDGLFFDKSIEHVTPDNFKENFNIII